MFLTASKSVSKSELYQFNCGHSIPSKEDQAHLAFQDRLGELFKKKYLVSLNSDDSVKLSTDENLIQKGKWTMIYDEGFNISVNDKNKSSSFFTFSKYGKNIYSSDLKSKHIESKWISYCYSTLVGWYHEGDNWGCFYATKNGVDPNEVTNGEVENKLIVVENSINEKNSILPSMLKVQSAEPDRIQEATRGESLEGSIFDSMNINFLQSSERLLLSSSFKDHSKVVQRLNAENLGWNAKSYDEFQGLTIEQLNKFAGRMKRSSPNEKTVESNAIKGRNKYISVPGLPTKSLLII